MNREIRQLFLVVVILLGALIVRTTWITVVDAEELQDRTANRRPLLEEQRIPRGLIVARDGKVLARNDPQGSGASRIFSRLYPENELFAHAVGYSFVDRGRSGLERSRNDALAGEESEFESLFEDLTSGTREGDDIRTTLDPQGQRAAIQALGGRRGAVVAMEPQSGRVRVMASVPSFDPNRIPGSFSQLSRDDASPLVNRATQSLYPPGSVMKVVTAAAALDTGRYDPGTIVDGRSPKEISGVPLQNFGNQDFGPVSLTDALTNSVNTVWGEVAEKLGKETMYRYMERFGFNEDPPLDYPDSQMAPSGVYDGGELLDADDGVDIGRVAIGQERLLVTPLQMAMVASAVGNRGSLMRPRLVERIVATDGRIEERVEAEEESQVMKAENAEALTAMMSRVVQEGTGTAAALEGVEVAGKTGTAEVDSGNSNQAWFIGFAPVGDPRMAVAVTVERTQGQGGTVAAPIAKQVLQELLR